MSPPPPRPPRTDTLFPYSTLFRSERGVHARPFDQRIRFREIVGIVPILCIHLLISAKTICDEQVTALPLLASHDLIKLRSAASIGCRADARVRDRKSTRLNSSH